MKSTVCKKANELIRKGYTRSEAFKIAWAMAKGNSYNLRTADLAEGNIIRIEFGTYENFVNCTITSVSNELYLGKYHIVKAISQHGQNMEFCSTPTEKIEVIAA